MRNTYHLDNFYISDEKQYQCKYWEQKAVMHLKINGCGIYAPIQLVVGVVVVVFKRMIDKYIYFEY